MFELRVLSGQHQGAALPLVGEQWSIGSAEHQDLALDDPGVAPLHGWLRRTAAGWAVDGEGGALYDAQGTERPSAELADNTAFQLGPVWLCVSPAHDGWPAVPAVQLPPPAEEAAPQAPSQGRASSPVRRRVAQATWLVAGLAAGVAGSAWNLTRTAPPAAPPSAVAAAIAPAPGPPAPGHARTRLADATAVARQLNTMLSDRLLSQVTVMQTPAGLELSGELQGEALQVYQRMLQRFKEGYSSPVTVLDNVGSRHDTLPFVVVQIMTGPHAHIVTADGKRLYVGDSLQGLRLARIDEHRLQFDGERPVEVAW